MNAHEVGLIKFLQQQDTQFIIPVYQRNYDWGHSHCKQLFNDILNTAKNEWILSHFIGSIVFIYDSIYSTTSPTYLTIMGLLPIEWVKMREKSLRTLNIREF